MLIRPSLSLRRAAIAIPAGLHGPILHSLRQKTSPDDAIYETRFISFVIAIGILMLFFGPHVVWKFMGQKRATELVKRWESEDARLHAPGAFIPVWTVRLAGYLSADSVRRSDAPPSPRLDSTLLFSASLFQPHTHPLHHTSIRLRIHLRYDALMPLSIIHANDSSGLMALLTLMPLNTSRRHIKATSSKLCTARSRSTEIPTWGPVCHFRLMPLTAGEPTRMKRLA